MPPISIVIAARVCPTRFSAQRAPVRTALSLRYRGLAPYVGYSFERNRSSIPIHERRNHGLIAGVSRAF